MSDYPHGHKYHNGGGCNEGDCAERKYPMEVITKIKGEHSTIYTNGKVGGWVEIKDGTLVSEEYLKSLNRRERRKLGVRS